MTFTFGARLCAIATIVFCIYNQAIANDVSEPCDSICTENTIYTDMGEQHVKNVFQNDSSHLLSTNNSEEKTDTTIYDSIISDTPTQNYNKFQQNINKMVNSKLYQLTYAGVPLIIGGLIVKNEDDHFRQFRNEYMPKYKLIVDDYLQYSPAAVMLGMKIAGIKGRSTWGRMWTSDAFSVLIMAAAVNTIKYQAKVRRPDGSNRHSFPSGHTATAFMTATMLAKEYGNKSYWYCIGAYTVATTTGLMRMANNKHWLSDVLAGAGIGILSTEFGYYIADLIFKDKGLQTKYDEKFLIPDDYKPSFIGLYLGLNLIPGSSKLSDGSTFELGSGCSAGFEGAYFLNQNFGLGGRFTASTAKVLVNEEPQDDAFGFNQLHLGGYFSYPIIPQLLIGGKLLGGITYYHKYSNSIVSLKEKKDISFGTGLSVTFLAKKNLGARFFADYNLIPSMSSADKGYNSMISLGTCMTITF